MQTSKILLINANEVSPAGKAEAVAKDNHVTSNRYIHHVTACILNALQREAHAI